MLQENGDLHIPTGAGSLTSRGDLISKRVLEISFWQESSSLSFLFLKEYSSLPLSITLYSCNCDQKTLPFDSPSDTLLQPSATDSVPAWKSAFFWRRQMTQTSSPAEERVHKWVHEAHVSWSTSNLQGQTASFKSHTHQQNENTNCSHM